MSTTLSTIATLLNALEDRVISAGITTSAAQAAAAGGRQNECIGTLLPIEQDLAIALDLTRTILALHRSPPSLISSEKAGA